MILWKDLPPKEQARLKDNERAQRAETKARGLPVLPCDPEALWLLQCGMCTCNECRGTQPLIIGEIVIAHIFFRGGVGSPGHVPHNVALWNSACNLREAGLETKAGAKGKRMAVNKPAPRPLEAETETKRPSRSRGFQGSRKFNGERKWRSKQ